MNVLNIFGLVPYIQLSRLGIISVLLFISLTKTSFANNSVTNPQNQEKICPQQNSIPRRSFETQRYWGYICLGDRKNPLGYFVRTVKNDSNKIILPLTQVKDETYTATNEEFNYSYVINPYELLVYKNQRLILRDRTINSYTADGQLLTNACPQGGTQMVEALTPNFLAYVCQNGKEKQQLSLHIIARKGNERITAPLEKTSEHNNSDDKSQKFVAVRGQLRYILTPEMLKIWLDPKTTVKERVLEWN